ncbi:MAG: sulfatase-like hydrolase/transferase, partial [Proteobacteria bacterium]|nr:sulfatase-like hydrolase/transferase [Pseudomonadota bacterium]
MRRDRLWPDRRSMSAMVTICLFVAASAADAQGPDGSPPNILVILGDDMGVETLASFGVGTQTPRTATLDALAERGVRFSNMWSQAMCSPTRATILTGRYGFRTGVGGPTGDNIARGPMPEPPPVPAGVVEFGMGTGMGMGTRGAFVGSADSGRWGITPDEFTLTQALAERPDLGYDKAAIGKWHLSDVRNGWQDHPNL